MRLMMQSLLTDRFRLKVHFENRESPVLALTLVNPGKPGPSLRPHSGGPPCPDTFEMAEPLAPIETPKPGVVWPSQCGNTARVRTSKGTWLGARNTTIELLARHLFSLGVPMEEVDGAVVDRTGLHGRFDYMLAVPDG